MNKKYIVKNCPCFNEGHPDLDYFGECLDLTQAENDCCSECTDCIIKQVIEKCKSSLDYHSDKEYVLGRTNMAGNILALFEIEEVNNDR